MEFSALVDCVDCVDGLLSGLVDFLIEWVSECLLGLLDFTEFRYLCVVAKA